MKTRESVIALLNENSALLDWESLDKYSSNYYADRFDMSRNTVSELLNDYFSKGKLIKINTRPVLFFSREHVINKNNHLLNNVYKSIEDFQEDLKRYQKKSSAFNKLIGYNGSLSYIVDQCKSAVTYPEGGLATLLLGPTGSGKSLIAQIMFEYGLEKGVYDKNSRFIVMNCSEYSNNPELFLTNFFGNIKGAYTGASQDREGLVKLADGGMLFLDEVHCLRPECQEKLYLFMDKGIYHMVGDNDKWYQSNVSIVFATTEEPKSTLVKPLLRRIPIICRVPSLSQRPKQEKKELLYSLLQKESERISKEISLSKRLYQLLIDFVFTGNIGDMQNCIKVCVASALMEQALEPERIKIDFHHLPDYVINEMVETRGSLSFEEGIECITLKSLREDAVKEKNLYLFNEKLLNLFQQNNSDKGNFELFIELSRDLLLEYIDEISFHEENKNSVKEVLYQGIFENIRLQLSQRYKLTLSNTQIMNLSRLLYDFLIDFNACTFLIHERKSEIENLLEYISNKDSENYNIGKEVLEILSNSLNVDFGILGELDFYFYLRIMRNSRKSIDTIGIVLAHGYSTASSITTTANYMLGSHIFDSLDMPIDMQAVDIAGKLSNYIASLDNVSNLVIMVDMGSLEEIHNNIIINESINMVIFNNVTMKLVLDIGMMILQGENLRNVIQKVSSQDYHNKHIYIESKKKSMAILTVCPTGISTANKFKQLLLDSLPKKVDTEIISCVFEEINEQKNGAAVFDKYNVQYIVGTVNPQIPDHEFIPIEELIERQNLDNIKILFDKQLTVEEIEQFGHNILKNFSLQNLLEYLTILNPEKIVNYTEEIIQSIKQEIEPNLLSSKIVGLYIHISCLIERLITDKYITKYDNIKEFSKNNQAFISHVKHSFEKLENNYCVEIPISEIAYIHDFIYKH